MKPSRKATHGRTPNLRHSKPQEDCGEEHAAAWQVETKQQGLSLERKIEVEKHRRFSLINKVNRLTASVKEKQDQLEGSKKVISFQQPDQNREEIEKQYQEIQQLEKSLGRMKVWTEETKRYRTAGKSISANLNSKSFFLDHEINQKERQLADELVDFEKVMKQRDLDLAAATNKKNQKVQMENEALELRKQMSVELQKLHAQQIEIQTHLEAMGQSELITGNNLAEAASSAPVSPSSMDEQDNVSEPDVHLLEDDVNDPTDSLDFYETEQLKEEAYLINEDIRQKVYILKELKLHYAILQHSVKAEGKRSHKVMEEERLELNKEVHHVHDLRAALKGPQALLSTVEQRINDMCFILSCLTLEELSSLSNKDKIWKIRIQLNIQKTDAIISNKKKMLQVYNMKDDSSESSEDEGFLTHEAVKENSRRLVEAQQGNMTSGNSWKKKQTM